MDIAFFIYSGRVNNVMCKCLKSLKAHSDCQILFYAGNMENASRLDINMIDMDISQWKGRRMTRRVEIARKLPAKEGDYVIVMDTDLEFRGDPFSVFTNDFDVFYTTRYYSCNFPVNAGFWGFRINPGSKRFLDFFVQQINTPTWPPYVNFIKKHQPHRKKSQLDWWSNQDFLCVVHGSTPPTDTMLFDAGWKYNCCPRSGGGIPLTTKSINEFFQQSKHAIVVHYKELEKRKEILW